MRGRAGTKREELIRIAAALFNVLGYEGTSISEIATRAGASKATLYAYFGSKENLLRAALDYDFNEEAERLMHKFLAEKDLRTGLIKLGIAYLSRQPALMANIRTVANQPIAREFYDEVLRPAWQRLADKFATLMHEGRLKFSDPWIAAMHWKGLNEGDSSERHLLLANTEADRDDIVTAATAAADAFLKIYSAQPDPGMAALWSGESRAGMKPHREAWNSR